MQDSTQRFSSRVDNYVKYRPHYPKELIDALVKECGLAPEWWVADIGSGTGISSELFLQNGNLTYGVEPNQPMREAAERLLGHDSNFISIDGTAEQTTLDTHSIDLIVAGQAFHWFDRERAKIEFQRILKPNGWVVLVWNERRQQGSPFLNGYEQILQQYAGDYLKVRHRNIDEAVLQEFFAPASYRTLHFENKQQFDFEGLKGRLLSSSYAPEPGQPGYDTMIAELEQLFRRTQENGLISFEYDTNLYLGQFR